MEDTNKHNQNVVPNENLTDEVVESFSQSFESSNLVDAFSQVGEFAIDQAFENDLLKDIPFFGLLISGYKTVVNIKNFNLTRKVYRFLYHLQDTTPKQRAEFSHKFCEANQEDTAVALLDILDKLNNWNAVPIVCNLIKAVINERLTIQQFNRLIVALQRTAYTDLNQLEKFETEYNELGLSDALLSSGLIYQSVIDGETETGVDGSKYLINQSGSLMLRFGLNKTQVEDNPRLTKVVTEITPLTEEDLNSVWNELPEPKGD